MGVFHQYWQYQTFAKEQTQNITFSHIFWYFTDALIWNKLNLCCWPFYFLEEPTETCSQTDVKPADFLNRWLGSCVLPAGCSGPWGSRMERLEEKTAGTSALCQNSSAWTTSTAAPEASGSVRKHCGSFPYIHDTALFGREVMSFPLKHTRLNVMSLKTTLYINIQMFFSLFSLEASTFNITPV